MIESLATDAAAEGEGSQPLRRSLVFSDITFEGGKLWQPRYPSLFRYHPGVSGLQVEPGFRICTKDPLEIEITFELAKDRGVAFVREGEGVKCRAISNPRDPQVPGLAEARWVNETTCTLVWKQSDANEHVKRRFQDNERRQEAVALRIFCEGGSKPADKREEALAAVEGGLYLAILYSPSDNPLSRVIDVSPPDVNRTIEQIPEKPTIRVVDIDPQRRPVYDLFHPMPVGFPLELELEPTYRVREGEMVEVDLSLDIARLQGIRWKAVEGEAEVTPLSIQGRPRQLQTCAVLGEDGTACRVRWFQQTGRSTCVTGTADASQCYCTTGHVSSFLFSLAELDEADKKRIRSLLPPRVNLDEVIETLAQLAIDPTVIEPATCTPEGVCIPAGGGGGTGPRTQLRPTDS